MRMHFFGVVVALTFLAFSYSTDSIAHEALRTESFAHTSPIYLDVAGQSLRSPEDAKYFIQWIERLYADVRKRNRIPAGQQAVVEKQIAEALEFYKKQAGE